MLIQSPTKAIPKELIYEMDDGKPIFYKGYRHFLNESKYENNNDMGDSSLQAWLKGKIFLEISHALAQHYDVTVGEQGLSLSKHNWRAVDIAVFRFGDLVLNNQYSKKPPLVAIEIDLKAHFDSPEKAVEYYENKNARLLAFGVQKIIWAFSGSRKVRVISVSEPAKTFEWSEDVPVIEDVKLNLDQLFVKYRRSDLSGLK